MTSLDLAFDDEFEAPVPNPNKKHKQNIEDEIDHRQEQPQSQTFKSPPPVYQKAPPQPPPKQEHFSNYYQYQEEQPQQVQRPQQTYQYSFWDRMVISRREVMKLFILSIVIFLGISLEKIGSHYVNQYLSSNDLTAIQEFLVRLSFPIIVFIILWIIKSL